MKFDMKKTSPASTLSASAGSARPGPPPVTGKRYKLEFSRTGLFGFGAVTLLGLVWVFIFGVLVGRGYRPETAVPELARIMPTEQNAGMTTADQGVLPPEELEFYDALKKGGNVSPQLPQETKPVHGGVADGSMHPSIEEEDLPPAEVVQDLSKPKQPTPAAAPAASAKHQPAAAPAATATATAQAKPAPAKPATPAPAPAQEILSDDDDKGPPGQRYAYVYQAAAFNEASKAESFKVKMQGLNLKASVQKVEDNGKTWHRVMVHFEGKPEDTRQLKEKLKQAGIEKALLRSKKPI